MPVYIDNSPDIVVDIADLRRRLSILENNQSNAAFNVSSAGVSAAPAPSGGSAGSSSGVVADGSITYVKLAPDVPTTLDVRYVNVTGDTMTGGLTINAPLIVGNGGSPQNVTITGAISASTSGTFGALTSSGAASIGGTLTMGALNTGIELGTVGQSNAPYLNFHSSVSSTAYDGRIVASGGTGTAGQGALSYIAASHSFTGSVTVQGGVISTSLSRGMSLQAGNSSTAYAYDQIIFGFQNSQNYSHSIKTRHNAGAAANNAFDFFLWNSGTDAIGTVGTYQAMTLDRATGLSVFGPVSTLGMLDVSAAGGTQGATGTALGDKIALYSGGAAGYGLGIQPNRIVAYVPAGTTNAFSVRAASASGNASSGTDVITLFANGASTFTGLMAGAQSIWSNDMNLYSAPATATNQQSSPRKIFQSTYWNGTASVAETFNIMAARQGAQPGSAGNYRVMFGTSSNPDNNLINMAGDGSGAMGIGSGANFLTSGIAQLYVSPTATTRVGLVARGLASQTANLQEWQNSGNSVLASVSAAGGITANTLSLGNPTVAGPNLVVNNDAGGTSLSRFITGSPSGQAVLEIGATDANTYSRLWRITVGGGNVSGTGAGTSPNEGTFGIHESGTQRVRVDRGGLLNALFGVNVSGTVSANNILLNSSQNTTAGLYMNRDGVAATSGGTAYGIRYTDKAGTGGNSQLSLTVRGTEYVQMDDTSTRFTTVPVTMSSTLSVVGSITTTTGAIQASNGKVIAASSAASTGYVDLVGGTTTNTGYVEFQHGNGVRSGFIGFGSVTPAGSDGGSITYQSGSHQFNGTVTMGSTLTVSGNASLNGGFTATTGAMTGNLTINTGKQVYYSGIGTSIGVTGSDIRFDTITGGAGAGVGNLAASTVQGYNVLDGSLPFAKLSGTAQSQVRAFSTQDTQYGFLRRVSATGSSLDADGKETDGLAVSNGATRVADGSAYAGYAITNAGATAGNQFVVSGPAYTGLAPGQYDAVFYLRASNTSSTAQLLSIQMLGTGVTGNPGVGIAAADLATTYVGVTIPFTVGQSGQAISVSIANNLPSSTTQWWLSHVKVAPSDGPATAKTVQYYFANAAITSAQIRDLTASLITAGTINSDDIYLGTAGHIYAGNKAGGRVELNAAGLQAYQTVNLVPLAISSFETSAPGTSTTAATGITTSTNCGAAITAAAALDGKQSLAVTTNAAGAFSFYFDALRTSSQFATAGVTYTLSTRVRAAVTGRNVTATLRFANATPAVVGSFTSATVAETTTGWTTLTVTGTAPAGTVTFDWMLSYDNSAAGEVHYVDNQQFEVGTTATVFTTNTSASATTFGLNNNGILSLTNPTGSRIVMDPHVGLNFYDTNSVSKLSLDVTTGNLTTTGVINATGGSFSGSITATGTITGGTLSGATITGGSLNIGSGTFTVSNAGALVATSATISGSITATSLNITGAATINSTLTLGTGSIASTNFNVTSAGLATMTGATVSGTITTGNITATGGTVGGWTLNSSQLFSTNAAGAVYLDKTGYLAAYFDGAQTKYVIMDGRSGSQGFRIYNGTANTFSADLNGNVTLTGAVTATSLNISGAATINSTLTLGTGSIASTNFNVTSAGVVTAASATLTGATVTGTITTSNLTVTGLGAGGFTVGTSPNWFSVDNTGRHWSGTAAFPASAATAKFAVDTAGVMWATGATITGALTATTLNISGAATINSTLTLGTGSIVSTNFNVTSAGVVSMTGATVTGQINATSGTFSGSISASALTLTGGSFSGQTITAANLNATNTISGLALTAGTVTTAALNIASGFSDNLVLGGGFEDETTPGSGVPSNWTNAYEVTGTTGVFSRGTTNTFSGTGRGQIVNVTNGGSSIASTSIPVATGDVLAVKLRVRAETQTGPFYIRLYGGTVKDFTRAQVGTATFAAPIKAATDTTGFGPSGGTGYASFAENQSLPAVNTYYLVEGTVTIPAGVSWVRLGLYGWSNTTSGWTAAFDDVVIRQQATTTQIADGVITTAKIVATGISGTTIQANTLSAQAITTSTLNASTLIQVGATTGARAEIDGRTASPGIRLYDATNTVTLNADALTGNLTLTGTVNATGGTFSGNITATGTISGGTISGAAVTGTSISGTTITGGTITGSRFYNVAILGNTMKLGGAWA